MLDTQGLKAAALAIRSLSIDAIERAQAGHPGLPLGCAELGALLYGDIMRHNPDEPLWPNRDRFVLSAGHGSMLLYSLLHLAGYGLPLSEIERFRQGGSLCPGHPEFGVTKGIDATTGPLGQGIAMAVGMAIAATMLAARFNTAHHTIIDHYTYALVGEGCLMEGVSSEASSLAGHLGLSRLIVFYDKNHITIDGSSGQTLSEDIAKRYEAYGWQVLSGDMYDPEGIARLIAQAKADERPSFIMLTSVIGKGAPNEGTASVHGAPLGKEKAAAAKQNLGLPADTEFFIPEGAKTFFAAKKERCLKDYADWLSAFRDWAAAEPEKYREWEAFFGNKPSADAPLPSYEAGAELATRKASGAALKVMAKRWPQLVGGSADLEGPNMTALPGLGIYSKTERSGRTIRFGIREFAMAAISAGISLHGGLRPFCATFAVFADYLRPSIRLAALMKQPVIYVLTHDSIYVGEDGPTHQPIETFSSLRAIPNVQVIRAADAEEASVAWEMALESSDHPVCLAFTRQNVAVFTKEDPDWKTGMRRGAYIVRSGGADPEICLLAAGSEVGLALEASKLLPEKKIRILSVCDRELFKAQSRDLRLSLTGKNSRIIAVEAGTRMGWEGLASSQADLFCIDRFGESAPAKEVGRMLGFTAENLAELIRGTD